MANNIDYIRIPREEYEELIECKIHINAVYDLITGRHKACIQRGRGKSSYVPMCFLEMASGYVENEKYFEKLKAERQKKEEKQLCE